MTEAPEAPDAAEAGAAAEAAAKADDVSNPATGLGRHLQRLGLTKEVLRDRQLLLQKSKSAVRKVLYFTQTQYHRVLGHAAAIVPDGPVGGLCGVNARLPFTSEQILLGYAQGMYPVDLRGQIHWQCPDPRCVVPLDQLHVPSRIRTYLRKGLFELCFDRDPIGVLAACGDRKGTWLTQRIQDAYKALFDLGAMHTVEAWKGDRLVGGAFGVAMGTVFTVESMFSHEDHASKLAFAYLCNHLKERGFTMVDCQFQQDHFARFGAIELPREEYRKRVALGLLQPRDFNGPPLTAAAEPAAAQPEASKAAGDGAAASKPAGEKATGDKAAGDKAAGEKAASKPKKQKQPKNKPDKAPAES